MSTPLKAIDLVRTPLGFFVFFLILIESLLGFMYSTSEGVYKEYLLWSILGFLLLVFIVVLLLSLYNRVALTGKRGWVELYSYRLIMDVYHTLDGYISNLPNKVEYKEAWLTLSDVLKNSTAEDAEFNEFCHQMSKDLDTITKLRGYDR